MSDRQEMEAVLEAILFASPDPVPREKLLAVFAAAEQEDARRALETLIERHRERASRGWLIDEVAGGLRFVTRPDLHGYLRRFFEVTGGSKLSMAALETLAIVAYRQPVTAPEIQELRGVSSSGVLKTLLERRMIRVAGRKEVVGKPFLYATTRDFLMHFGLRSLKELPPLEQFEELFGPEMAEDAGEDVEERVEREVVAVAEAEAEKAREAELAAEEAAREEAEIEALAAEQGDESGAAPGETAGAASPDGEAPAATPAAGGDGGAAEAVGVGEQET